jgi:hypothetical protein
MENDIAAVREAICAGESKVQPQYRETLDVAEKDVAKQLA